MDVETQSGVADIASNVSITDVQNSLRLIETWDGWRDKLQSVNSNNADWKIESLFNSWNP